MEDVSRLKNIAYDLIVDATSELEIAIILDKIRMTLNDDSNCKKELSRHKSRVQRAISASKNCSAEENDLRMNKIVDSILKTIDNLTFQDFIVLFEYDKIEGIIYKIFDRSKKETYRFIGNLSHGKPSGHGTAKFANGDIYEGAFKDGVPHGSGKLFDNKGRIVQTGKWENGIYLEKGMIRFYQSLNVAASQLKGHIHTGRVRFEYLKLPNINNDGLIALPIEGDSMEPTFSEKDIVVCRELSSILELNSNKPYVVFHNDKLHLKLIQLVSNGEKIIKLRLISENHLNHSPFEIRVTNYVKIFKVVAHIKYH